MILIICVSVLMNILIPNKVKKDDKNVSIFNKEISQRFTTSLKNNLSEEVSGLAQGYLLGDKSALEDGLEEKIKTVGLAHIIVVSGTHLSIIMMSIRKIFNKISRFLALYFSLAGLIIYVGIIGLSPSILRASIVAIFGLFAWFFGRKYKPSRIIILTLGICLIIDPWLISEIGFQMSIMAYVGILLILPKMIKFFYGRDKPKIIGNIMMASISAMSLCLPLQIYYFGNINIGAILANLLILPTIPLAMLNSFMTGFWGMLGIDLLANIVGRLTDGVLRWQIRIVNFLYEKTELNLTVPKKMTWILMLYLIFLMIGLYVWKKEQRKRIQKIKNWHDLENINIWKY